MIEVRICNEEDPNIIRVLKDAVQNEGGKVIVDMAGLRGFLYAPFPIIGAIRSH